jgi:hypothetical protein
VVRKLVINKIEKMKLYKFIFLLLGVAFFASCGNEYDTEEYFDLEELPGYVAFDADGNNATIDEQDVEEGTSTEAIVESPTEVQSDITVNYTLSGTAVYGTDYTVEGATAAGGEIVISSDRGDFTVTYRSSIKVTMLDNDFVNFDPRSIIITLNNASNAEGDVAVGRGGKEFLKEYVINITDDECPSEFAGTYMAVATFDSLTIDGMLVDTIFSTDTIIVTLAKLAGEYFSYNVDDASAGAYMLLGGNALSYDIVEDCGAVSAEGQTDEFGQLINLVSGGINGDGVISLTLKSADAGDQWTTVFIPN